MALEIEQTEVLFRIEDNSKEGGSGWAIVENPDTEYELARSPFDSEQEARQRELDIAEYWGFKAVEIK